MSNFIKKFLVFSLISLLTVCSVYFVSIVLVKKNLRLSLKSGTEFLFLGHSHVECAYNDKLISGSHNMGQSGEPYMYSYLKLKKLLDQNVQPKIVFLEFSNNQIQLSMNEWMFGNRNLGSRFSKYISFYSISDFSILTSHNFSEVLRQLSPSLKKNLAYLKNNKKNFLSYYGGYKELNVSLNENEVMGREAHTVTESGLVDYSRVSQINLNYLRELIDFCRKKGVAITLIRSPFHENYLINNNEEIYFEILKQDFSDVKYLDFSKFELNINELADIQHLNKYGAERYSNWFNHFLKFGKFDQSVVDSLVHIENVRLKSLERIP